MNQSTKLINGGSLEDCHTNLFHLTDLSGIRWRCWEPRSQLATNPAEPLEDPVLASFTKCMQADILCVWKRVSCQGKQRSIDSGQKQLWLFWYGDDPPQLHGVLSPSLQVKDQGSWGEVPLSYECRTLLFKALHNLIERCLVSQHFVRIGKWFAQPYDSMQTPFLTDKSPHLSIKFSFFMHSESQVCASIDVRQHAPLRRLQSHHLTIAQHSQNSPGIPVMLAPYGLSGIITGNTYKETERSTHRLLEEWKLFYLLRDEFRDDLDLSKMPAAVEVVVGGVTMRYPSCYVLITADVEDQLMQRNPAIYSSQFQMTNNSGKYSANISTSVPTPLHAPMTPPVSPACASLPSAASVSGRLSHNGETLINSSNKSEPPLVLPPPDTTTMMLMDSVWQDSAVFHRNVKETVGSWNFMDPSEKRDCIGCKSDLRKPSNHLPSVKVDEFNTEMNNVPPHDFSLTAFHKRNVPELPNVLDLDYLDETLITPGMPPTQTKQGVNTGSGSYGNQEVCDSPISAAPSPLLGNPNTGNPQTVEPIMPTLSPQAATSGENGDKKDMIGSLPAGHKFSLEAARAAGLAVPSVGPISTAFMSKNESNDSTTTAVYHNPWLRRERKRLDYSLSTMKQPTLGAQPYEDTDNENMIANPLYQFDAMSDTVAHPCKKPKYEPKINLSSATSLLSMGIQDPYIFDSVDELRKSGAVAAVNSQLHNLADSVKDEGEASGGISLEKDEESTLGISSQAEGASEAVNVDSRSLKTAKGLVPNYSDLDRMFDSDSDSNDHDHITLPVAGESDIHNDSQVGYSVVGSADNPDPVRNDVLQMFPTPPSHDTTSSPLTATDHIMTESHENSAMHAKTNSHKPHISRQIAMSIKDWSYVYQPAKTYIMKLPNQYAPIDLPSATKPKLPLMSSATIVWYPQAAIEKKVLVQDSSASMPNSIAAGAASANHESFMKLNSIEMSPTVAASSQRTPSCSSYELQSPASNSSSYLGGIGSRGSSIRSNTQRPQAHSLLLNVLLSDSLLNLFKDHNFDSCGVCACNTNVRGYDCYNKLYLDDLDSDSDGQYKCCCGFSAVVNRRLGFNAGLFYEDEIAITGHRRQIPEIRKPSFKCDDAGEMVPEKIFMHIQSQFAMLFPSCLIRQNCMKRSLLNDNNAKINHIELQDGIEVVQLALEAAKITMDGKEDQFGASSKRRCLHEWQFLQDMAKTPNYEDMIGTLMAIQPVLQERLQKKKSLWEQKFRVVGPLSWKDFHLLARRGNEEICEPQPVPSFVVRSDKDWLTLSPYSLQFWDKLQLEPYGKRHDVSYVVVAPDASYIFSNTRQFFKEFSSIYSLCKLGRHEVLDGTFRDGIYRVGCAHASKIGDLSVDEWFNNLSDGPLASKIKLYAQVCRHLLGPTLKEQISLFQQRCSHPAPSPTVINRPVQVDDSGCQSQNPGQRTEERGSRTKDRVSTLEQGETTTMPNIVVYVIDPFSYGSKWQHAERFSMLGLLRCFQELIDVLPESVRDHVHLQIIPLHNILDFRENPTSQCMKEMAFSVYSQCHQQLKQKVSGRSLTGFGPAAWAEKLLFDKPQYFMNKLKIHHPPFSLAPRAEQRRFDLEINNESPERSTTLFCVYCLSEDQNWLLAACIDNRGEILETTIIKIAVPGRHLRKKASARIPGLAKLWDFLLGVMSSHARPWRLVIGRLGRVGLGELIGWSGLLSKKNLQLASKTMKDMCKLCSALPISDHPCILSACLISLELHTSLHVLTESIKEEERQSSNINVETPHDMSTTHILCFPTSATASEAAADDHAEDDDSLLDINNIMNHEDNDDINSIIIGNAIDEELDQGESGVSTEGDRGSWPSSDAQTAENIAMNQQPLAMGFYISTAPTGPLPDWFWSACPHRKNQLPIPFKGSLHINICSAQVPDDVGLPPGQDKSRHSHPLESVVMCDVLRYVLESYNALSWLTLDLSTNERRSCLPAHFAVLMQLYNAINDFV